MKQEVQVRGQEGQSGTAGGGWGRALQSNQEEPTPLGSPTPRVELTPTPGSERPPMGRVSLRKSQDPWEEASRCLCNPEVQGGPPSAPTTRKGCRWTHHVLP